MPGRPRWRRESPRSPGALPRIGRAAPHRAAPGNRCGPRTRAAPPTAHRRARWPPVPVPQAGRPVPAARPGTHGGRAVSNTGVAAPHHGDAAMEMPRRYRARTCRCYNSPAGTAPPRSPPITPALRSHSASSAARSSSVAAAAALTPATGPGRRTGRSPRRRSTASWRPAPPGYAWPGSSPSWLRRPPRWRPTPSCRTAP